MLKTDSIGWLAEELVGKVLRRNQTLGVIHNSMADADDPTIGISLHDSQLTIPLPDFEVTEPAGLFSKRIEPRTFSVEVKAKTYFAYYKNWQEPTTGIENWDLECYQRFSEEYGREVQLWFVHIFHRCELNQGLFAMRETLPGIYVADIHDLYRSRFRCETNRMAYWRILRRPFQMVNLMSELRQAPDTGPIVERLRLVAERDATIKPR
jgi:hypothetical protein